MFLTPQVFGLIRFGIDPVLFALFKPPYNNDGNLLWPKLFPSRIRSTVVFRGVQATVIVGDLLSQGLPFLFVPASGLKNPFESLSPSSPLSTPPCCQHLSVHDFRALPGVLVTFRFLLSPACFQRPFYLSLEKPNIHSAESEKQVSFPSDTNSLSTGVFNKMLIKKVFRILISRIIE